MSHTQTTAAAARYLGFHGFDPDDHDYMLWDVEASFNGPSNNILIQVRFHMAASAATKQTAVRTAINDYLSVSEPGVSLTNSVIQISGQPV